MTLRKLGNSNLQVSAVSMGCWPIAGMTSLDVNESDSLATLIAALDSGINFFDTAYCYGNDGESEKLIAKAFTNRRDEIIIATKGGIEWDANMKGIYNGSPANLIRQCEQSLTRLKTDRVELYYLHCPAKDTPLEDSADALKNLMEQGKILNVGVSNLSLEQLELFQAICPITAYQPPYNMILRDIENDTLPWCIDHNVAVCVYWPLMKGLLAGKLARDHVFDEKDGRKKYPMFQGEQWQKNQDLLDALRPIAQDAGKSLAQLVINWTIQQTGITSAICGAKRAYQIEESAAALTWQLTNDQMEKINDALVQRGDATTRWAV